MSSDLIPLKELGLREELFALGLQGETILRAVKHTYLEFFEDPESGDFVVRHKGQLPPGLSRK
jgi:hypothetical protein